MFDIQEILSFLPHRYPFLLVDRILEYEPGKRIVGLKNVTINEPFFQGHFPAIPIMPGVLIVECMAQVGGCLLFESLEDRDEKLVFFMGIERAPIPEACPARRPAPRRGNGRSDQVQSWKDEGQSLC